jgi:release factor glutamine methyltransferase
VLIPRPETEHLVEKAIALAGLFATPRIVDVGTGSGAIAVALAQHLPGAQITATDLSDAALAVAKDNARRNGLTERIRFVQGDLLGPVAGENFDMIISNPPYIPARDRENLSIEVREYEPQLALFSGDDGLDVYRRLIPAVYEVLAPSGLVALEIGCGQAEAVGSLLRSAGFEEISFTPDLQGIARVASARRP